MEYAVRGSSPVRVLVQPVCYLAGRKLLAQCRQLAAKSKVGKPKVVCVSVYVGVL